MTTVRHPSKFSDVLLPVLASYLEPCWRVLDPFAGTGRIHELSDIAQDVSTWGVEIEPEWATMHPRTVVGNALALPFPDASFDAIVTSPCYGNRMADHHDAKDASHRITYRHCLGRPLHPDNSGQLQWGPKYREFHQRAWAEAIRVLKPAGRFILNVSDHVRKREVQPVSDWHARSLHSLGLMLRDCQRVETPRMRRGQNHEARVEYEWVFVAVKS